MKQKIAIPITEGILDAHFGHCKQFAMVDLNNNEIQGTILLDAPPHQPGLLPNWLAERGATDIIAGGMGQRAIELFNGQGVNVFVGAPKLGVTEIVEGFVNKNLSFTANYCDH